MPGVAVTGMAWTTPLGSDIEGVWEKLLSGATGIAAVPSEYPLRNEMAAAVPDFQRLELRRRFAAITAKTIRAALDDASVAQGDAEVATYLILGTSFGARLDNEKSSSEPLDQWTADLAAGIGAVPVTLSTACSSGADAILIGTELLRRGIATRCICGGADILTDSKRLAHSALGTMSPTFLRSFDQRRDGTLLGEGAGIVVLEPFETAAGRRNHAIVRGCGSSNDAAGLTAPSENGDGIRFAIGRCLRDGEVNASAVGLINAHGSGTAANDRVEGAVYSSIFGDPAPLVFATKGALGHSLGATGAIEAIAVIMGLKTGWVPPVVGLEAPIPECRLPLARDRATKVDTGLGLSLTIGFGGFNTALLFERTNRQ